MRGEHDAGHVLGHVLLGSPPHARGTHLLLAEFQPPDRITPACAGNTR